MLSLLNSDRTLMVHQNLYHLHMWIVHLFKVVASPFQWWFSFFKAARVLQVWWKVAAHLRENLWLLVENIRRVGNKENPNPRIPHLAGYVCCSFALLPILNFVHWGPTKNFWIYFWKSPENVTKIWTCVDFPPKISSRTGVFFWFNATPQNQNMVAHYCK